MPRRATIVIMAALAGSFAATLTASEAAPIDLERRFASTVRPFIETYCLTCHGKEKPKADFDLSAYSAIDAVARDYQHWELVLERLEAGEMPPKKAKQHPTPETRRDVIEWIQTLRRHEARKNAGDPGPVLARRLSNAEYDYTVRDLTGVDIRPTREFPVDPANQAGFDNSGESLAMSPALVKKYLQAARSVADHLILKPEGFAFAPHPVVADTDRDKYCVLRIVDFYKRQPTDYADYFMSAWRFKNRAVLGKPKATLADVASEAKVNPKYLATIWATLTETENEVGPITKLQVMWRALPAPKRGKQSEAVRTGCEEMRDYVVGIRERIVPEVKNLTAPQIQNGSQTLVMWKNREMAANRRRYDAGALQSADAAAAEKAAARPSTTNSPATNAPLKTPEAIRKGGNFLPPALTTTASSATFKMAAAKKSGDYPDLIVPADPAERARYEAAFARFANVFPDAFYITERGRVYLDAVKEQQNAGRLLSAGLHSMTGYFRDDAPLYDLILDEQGRRELDRLWREFDFAASVPQRMHTSFVWFERTDSSYMRDPEFDPYRPEDKSITEQAKIKKLAEIYLAKAQRNNASETVQQAIKEHFELVAANVLRVEQQRVAAEPSHLKALEIFAEHAYRRPLSQKERESLRAFYRESREENGLDHAEAIRDCVVSVLMSPNFCYRIDLVEAAGQPPQRLPLQEPLRARMSNGPFTPSLSPSEGERVPKADKGVIDAGKDLAQRGRRLLSDYALASRLSYFLWSSMPDEELLARAAAGELHRPDVLAAQARRMLKDPRIRNLATEFAGNWLDFRRFEEHNSVDRERFPAFDNELRRAMFEEPIRFFIDVVRDDRSVLNFLYADYTFVNAPLAKHYGIPLAGSAGVPPARKETALRNNERAGETPALPGPDDWARIERADKFGRGGLLPMAVFLTANSPGLRTSPVKRGYWVVRRVLGERIPPPPAVVPVLPNDEKNLGDLTLREVLARHREDKSCASCHARFDSFGLVFEGYGPVGERRIKDFGGRAIDTRAEFPGGSEGAGLDGLRRYLRKHRQDDFIDNLCRKLLAYALGRTLIPSDDSTVQDMRAKLAGNGYRFGNLVESIVTSPQFLNKRANDEFAKQ